MRQQSETLRGKCFQVIARTMRYFLIGLGLIVLFVVIATAVATFVSIRRSNANWAAQSEAVEARKQAQKAARTELLLQKSGKGSIVTEIPVIPTVEWRERRDEEQKELDSGALAKGDAFLTRIHPDAFLVRMENILTEYVEDVGKCEKSAAGFESVMKAIEKCVLAVNAVNREYDGRSVETDEREDICLFMDAVIVARGIDIDSLAASQKCRRYELTDRWREW